MEKNSICLTNIARPFPVRVFVPLAAIALTILLFGCDTTAPVNPEPGIGPLASLDCAALDRFTSERKTFLVSGTSTTFTTLVEGFAQKVNGYSVVRSRIVGETPEGLGEYIGCDKAKGFVDVATDSWNALEPENSDQYERILWEPPLFYCKYGDPEDTVCEWSGLFGGEPEREVSRVLGYETIEVPYGKLDNAMKFESSSFDESGLYYGPVHYWVDNRLGIVRAVELETGATVELLSYEAPQAAKISPVSTTVSGIQIRVMHRLLDDLSID